MPNERQDKHVPRYAPGIAQRKSRREASGEEYTSVDGRAATRRWLIVWRNEQTSSGGFFREKVLGEKCGEAARIMANHAVFFEEILENAAQAHLLEGARIYAHWLGAFG